MYFTVMTNSPEETFSVAEKLAGTFRGGEVVALVGGLGAGKTVFAKGIASGLQVKEKVLSPTFTIVREYTGRLGLNHFDFYRLGSQQELADIGFEEYLHGGVNVIEWADLFPDVLPRDAIRVEIVPLGDKKRKIRIGGYALDLEARRV